MANKELGNILKTLRNNCNLTQQQVADLLGLKNKSTLGSWETGKSEPNTYMFLEICKLYNVQDIYKVFYSSYNTCNSHENILEKEKITDLSTNTETKVDYNISQIISTNIIFYRKINGLTQKLLAQKLNVRNTTISNWETGANSIDISNLHKICKIFNITMNDLCSERNSFFKTLTFLRQQANLTQEELANKLGISKSTISMYENGKREPNFTTLQLIADFFNVDMNFLLSSKNNNKYPHISHNEQILLMNYNKMNTLGKERLVETSEDMISNPKYTNSCVSKNA